MDILTLKRYFIEQPTISKNAHKGEALASRSFIEFYINDQPLSSLLDKYYASNQFNTLKNNIGVFGSFSNIPLEIVKVKQLIGRRFDAVDFEELKNGLAHKFNDEITLTALDALGVAEVDLLTLKQAGSVNQNAKVVKVINTGAVTKAIKVTGLGATAGAKAAIEAAGGSVA